MSLTAAAAVEPDDMVLSLDASLKGPSELTAAQVYEDLEFLSAASHRGYAGHDFRWALTVIPLQPTSSQTLCDRLAAVFAPVRDTHLKAALEFKTCGAPNERGGVGENLATDGWLLKTKVHRGELIDVIAIPIFWPKYDSRWNGFLDAIRVVRAKGRPFIIDLRGNGGGDDAMGFEMVRILLGLPDHVNLPTPVESRTFRQTPEAFAIQSNHWAWSILRLESLGRPVPEYMRLRRSEILSWMERAKNHQFPERYVERLVTAEIDERRVFQHKVYILTDRGCASSCETTMQVMERLPHRILVGENTMGAVEFGDVGRVILPNSRVSVSLSTMSVKFRDGRRVEKSGYAPDLKVGQGGDALAAALEEIAAP